jgi:hypothetical protein
MESQAISTKDKLEQLHGCLEEHFRALSQTRDEQPVYMIEYYGSGVELQDITEAVRAALKKKSCTSSWWQSRYFPLLILATEAGYEYEGPGRDFWDRFAEYSSQFFDADDRKALSNYFRSAVKLVGAAEPPQSPWTDHFCHIAWPITHAVLPKDLQRSLARALTELQFAVGPDTPTEKIVGALKWASQGGLGVRFDQWLHDTELVGSLVHALLERTDKSWIDQNLICRIRSDIEQSPEAEHQMRIAHARQEKIDEMQGSEGTKGRTKKVPTRWCTLLIRPGSDGVYILNARFPVWAPELITPIREALKGLRFAPALWGAASPVRIERLLSAHPVELRLDILPEPGTKTFSDDDTPNLPVRIQRALNSFQFDLTLPMAFVNSEDGFIQLRSRRLASTGRIIVVAPQETDPNIAGLDQVGTLCGHQCFEVDTASSECHSWLRQLGFDLQGNDTLRWVGPPGLVASGESQFTSDDEMLVHVECDNEAKLSIVGSKDSRAVHGGDIIRITAPPGLVQLDLSSSTGNVEIAAWIGSDVETGQLCWAEWSGDQNTRALLNGDFSLKIQSTHPLEDIPIHVSIHAGGKEISSADGILESLPTTMGSHDVLWKTVLSDEALIRIRALPEMTLRISLGSIWRCELRFEQEYLSYWWVRDVGSVTAQSETGELPVQQISCDDPLSQIVDESDNKSKSDIALLIPTSEYSAPWGGICIGPEELELRREGIHKPRILRQVKDCDGGAGLEAVVQARLQWSLATSDNLAVEFRRRQVAREMDAWTVEATCGERWFVLESKVMTNASSTAARALVAACIDSTKKGISLGLDEFIETEQSEYRNLASCFIKALEYSIPDLETLLRSPSCLEDDAVLTALSEAFNDGYKEYGTRQSQFGADSTNEQDLNADVWYTTGQWNPGFRDALDRLELIPLLQLIWPVVGQRQLAELDYDSISESTLVDNLVRWGRQHRGGLQGLNWESDAVRTALTIWTSPAKAVRLPWELALPRMLVDRGMIRAIRYASLRYRIAIGAEELRMEDHL